MATLTIADLDNGKRDLETVDAVANSQADTTPTRFGQQTLTLAGALRRLGWQAPVPYAPGLTVDHATMTVERGGIVYRPDPALVPFTTGAWNPDQWRIVQNSSASGRVYQFATLTAAESAAASLPEGTAVIVEGESQGHVVGGQYVPDRGALSHVAQFANYGALEAYRGLADFANVADGITGGVFVRRGSAEANGITVIKDAQGRSWERSYSGDIRVEWAGASPSKADNADAIQAAANLAAKLAKDLAFPDGGFKIGRKIVIDGDLTAFKSVKWKGTFRSTGTLAGYTPENSGTVLITAGSSGLDVWFRRWFNESFSIQGIAFVDKTSVFPTAINPNSAIKIIKGNPTAFPTDKRYISNLIIEDVATVGYADPIVFRGNYRKDQGGGSYSDNYFGPTGIKRFYPYQCGTGVVLENATLNRLRISESLFFSLNSGAIVKREAVDIPVAGRTEQMIMCQLDMVHFEDVRGIFRLSGAPPSGEFLNYVTMIDVTRELCGLYDTQNGNPYGVIEYTNLNILGRHDQWGEVALQGIGKGSTVRSQMPWTGAVIGSGGKSGSPETVNVLQEKYTLASGGANLIRAVNLAEGLGKTFDIQTKVTVNSGAGGVKNIRSYGITQAGTGGRWHDVTGQTAAGVTVSTAASGGQMVEITVANSTGGAVTVEIEVVRNSTGAQCYVA